MELQLTPAQQRWYDLAAMHADDFATRAGQHDRENSFPFDNYEALKASGYSNMCVPEELGGGGASLLDLCIAQERLARGDGATALAITMHLLGSLVSAERWRKGDERSHLRLEEMAKDRLLFFGATAELAVDSLTSLAGVNYSNIKAERVDGGFRITGRKGFGTGTLAGDRISCSAIYDDPADGQVMLLFRIPTDTPGLQCLHDWDTLGMRATGSHSWEYKDVFVDDRYVVRHKALEWGPVVHDLIAMNTGNFGAVYLGIARAARDFAVEYTKEWVWVPFEHPVSYYPSSQFLAAEMDIGLKAAWALQLRTTARLSDPQNRDEHVIVDGIATQYFVTHTAVDVVNKAMELVGGAALAKRLPLERYYRDVRSGPIHPIGGYDALEMIGKYAFGLPRDVKPRWV